VKSWLISTETSIQHPYTLSSVTEIYTWHSLAAHSNALTGFHAGCAIDVSRFWRCIRRW